MNSSPRRGLTLVEVLAALVILGTLLAGMVMAKAHHTRQIALTQQRAVAVRVADELLSRWWGSPEGVPVNQRGVCESTPDWMWETRVVDNAPLQQLGARVVRVELRPAQSTPPAGMDVREPLVAVDLVLPDPAKVQARP